MFDLEISKNFVYPFPFNGKEIRMVNVNNEPWFIVKDIANMLEIKNIRQNLLTIDKNELKSINPNTLFKNPTVCSTYSGKLEKIEEAGNGGVNLTIISEGGFYSLVFTSKSPIAKEFKKCIATKLMPFIRKSMMPVQAQKVPTTFSEALRLAADLEDQKNEIMKQLEIAKPKIKFAEACEGAKNAVSIGTFAKFLNENGFETGQNRFFLILVRDKLLMKKNGSYEPTQKAVDLGIFTITEKYIEKINIVRITTRITQKGQQYLFKKYTGKDIERFAVEENDSNNEVKEIIQTSLFEEGEE